MNPKILLALVVAASLASAHHSFSATYHEDRQMTIEGDLVQFQYRNPHSFVHVEVKNPQTGEIVRWAVEWGSGSQLSQQGVSRDELKKGDHVIVIGNPGRTPEDHRLRMLDIKRTSDGWSWRGTFQ